MKCPRQSLISRNLIICSGAIFWAIFSSLPYAIVGQQASKSEAIPPYKDKTVEQWIGLLAVSKDTEERVAAAEAIGFMARDRKATYGGFSDVPIDSPEPPKLSPEALRPIVDALIRGMKDEDEKVRAASAVAASWMGSRAKSATPDLIRLLDDPNEDSRVKAVTAIGSIGPAAIDALPKLKLQLVGDPNRRIELAEAMRLIGAPPETYVPTLINELAHEGPAHYAAMQLGHLGDPAVPSLLV